MNATIVSLIPSIQDFQRHLPITGCFVLRRVLRHCPAAPVSLRAWADHGSTGHWGAGAKDCPLPLVAELHGGVALGGAGSLPWSSRRAGEWRKTQGYNLHGTGWVGGRGKHAVVSFWFSVNICMILHLRRKGTNALHMWGCSCTVGRPRGTFIHATLLEGEGTVGRVATKSANTWFGIFIDHVLVPQYREAWCFWHGSSERKGRAEARCRGTMYLKHYNGGCLIFREAQGLQVAISNCGTMTLELPTKACAWVIWRYQGVS